MNRVLVIGLFSSMTIGLLISGNHEKKHISVFQFNSQLENSDDTTNITRYIKVDTFNLTIFPPSTGVQFYKEGIVFLAQSKNKVEMVTKHISFGALEAYYAMLEDTILGKYTIFSSSSPFLYPCEAITFSDDFNTMYFTKFHKRDSKEKIFQAKYSLNKKNQLAWSSELAPLNFCVGNAAYSHPALSNDEKLLIFASDKEGSFGGMDLFITRKEGEIWSEPENLGSLINTKGNEFYPFLDSDNNLFFSSDGLSGYGGFDIFSCKYNGQTWDEPINLSGRINSEEDEIAFTVNKLDGKTGFYTKRTKTATGNMQLFKITVKEEVADSSLFTISYIFNGKPVPQSRMTSMNIITKINPINEPLSKDKSIAELIRKDTILIPLKKQILPDIKNDDVIVPETDVSPDTVPVIKTETKPEILIKPPEAKIVTIKPTIPTPDEYKDIVIYRVQFLSSIKPQKTDQLFLVDKTYTTYEYYYLGEFRYTIGEFTTLPPAIELQRICRQSGHPSAFVAAFKNNSRSLDLKLFK